MSVRNRKYHEDKQLNRVMASVTAELRAMSPAELANHLRRAEPGPIAGVHGYGYVHHEGGGEGK